MTQFAAIPVVVYGVKSSPDEKESVKDQHRQVLAAIETEGGRRLVGDPFGEANASGYRGERGPQLEAAMRTAIDAAAEHGEAELWVFHSSRLGRGNGRKGRRSINLLVAQLLYEDVIVRSVADPEFVTPMLAGIGSEVAHKYSADLSAHVKRGLQQRRDQAKPVGAVPVGYRPEPVLDGNGQMKLKRDGKAEMERVIDPQGRAVVERMWDLVEAGHAPGQISRTLNAEGARTVRGGHWTTRAVRRVLTNPDYCGGTGYPQLIERERWDAIQGRLTRLDAAAVQARKGGRPAPSDFMLAGLTFCRACGAPMRVRRYWNGTRVYRCRNTLEGIGLCKSRPVRAEVAEQHVLEHLHWFIGSVEVWLAEKVQERSDEQRRREAAVQRERAALDGLDLKRERLFSEYEALVAEGDRLARLVLERIDRVDRERETQRQAITEAEAVISEWTGGPDTDAALDYYNAIVGVIEGKVSAAKGVKELNAALATVIAGVWVSVEHETLHAEFQLRPLPDDPTGPNALAQILSQDLAGRRMTLPSRQPGDPSAIELTRGSLQCAELDHTPSCKSTPAARRSRGTRSPLP
jgi:DNA invertase Pin-like site-specific DNA recombinase